MTTAVRTELSTARPWRAAWRQHGLWVSVTLVIVLIGAAALAAIVVLIPECASGDLWSPYGPSCDITLVDNLWDLWRIGMTFFPPAAGVLLGAVTFGADIEHRTAVLALTQGVGRLRWWTAKVVLMAGPVFAAVLALGLVALAIVDEAQDQVLPMMTITSPGFDTMGMIPAARFLLGFAVAAAAALLWRTIGGVVAGLLIVAAVVVGGARVQPSVVPHERLLVPIDDWFADSAAFLPDEPVAYGWGGYANVRGEDIDLTDLECVSFEKCAADLGVVYRVDTWVTQDQHPRMMLIIGGLDLAVAGAFLGLGARTLSRRDL